MYTQTFYIIVLFTFSPKNPTYLKKDKSLRQLIKYILHSLKKEQIQMAEKNRSNACAVITFKPGRFR